MLPPSELSQIGFTLTAYPFATLNPAIVAMQQSLRALASETEDASATRARFGLPFEELQRVVGFPHYYEQEARYKNKS
jgi:2-methylisocitrate lyase-like PEP mutase family enzyme